MAPVPHLENRIWKSGTTLPDSLRMPLKVSQDVRSAMRPFNCLGYQGSNPQSATENGPISNRFPTDFQQISNFQTVQDGQPYDTPENQNPKIPHDYAQ
jgi:hypothetical protein